MVIEYEGHGDDEAGEGQKEDIAHVLRSINAILKTAGYKKTFQRHSAPIAGGRLIRRVMTQMNRRER